MYNLLGLYCSAAEHRFYSSESHFHLTQKTGNIISALLLLEDDESRDVFYSCMHSYVTGIYEHALPNRKLTQYMDVNVPLQKGYSAFVDCGAFIGDSLDMLLKYHDCSTYIAFEPDAANYQALIKTVERQSANVAQTFLFHSAVSDTTGYAFFSEDNTSGSALTEKEGKIVQTVALDDCLKHTPVTMIKMDIEGAEQAALMGTKHIIQTQQPDLAICAYHKMNDLWELPLLLHQMVPHYKFYLRSHSDANLETVLYASCL